MGEESKQVVVSADKDKVDYNPDLEFLLKIHAEECESLSILHRLSYEKYNLRSNYINIPVIILSSAIGFVTGVDLQYDRMNLILGIGSVFVGIIKSIDSYFQLSQRAESHRLCSLQFAQITKKIQIELALQRDQRVSAKDMLTIIKTDIKNLNDIAPLIDVDIIDIYNGKYGKYTNVKKPNFVNGLTEVIINGHMSNSKDEEQQTAASSRRESLAEVYYKGNKPDGGISNTHSNQPLNVGGITSEQASNLLRDAISNMIKNNNNNDNNNSGGNSNSKQFVVTSDIGYYQPQSSRSRPGSKAPTVVKSEQDVNSKNISQLKPKSAPSSKPSSLKPTPQSSLKNSSQQIMQDSPLMTPQIVISNNDIGQQVLYESLKSNMSNISLNLPKLPQNESSTPNLELQVVDVVDVSNENIPSNEIINVLNQDNEDNNSNNSNSNSNSIYEM